MVCEPTSRAVARVWRLSAQALAGRGSASPALTRCRPAPIAAAGLGLRQQAGDASHRHLSLPTLHLGVLGCGLVGRALLKQVADSWERVADEVGVRIEVSAVARSNAMALLPRHSTAWRAVALQGWQGLEASCQQPLDLKTFGDHLLSVAADRDRRAVLVDTTASDAPADEYPRWLWGGVSVVTPNKRAGSGALERYDRIRAAVGHERFLYEATVGAGLPILGPLAALRLAGDEVEKVEGILSGTLSYIFNTWRPGVRFSDVVADAKAKGFTEPDPRDDLSGRDVQRKVVILARELGLRKEMTDVPVKSLVPPPLQEEVWRSDPGMPVGDAFVERLREYDSEMDAMIKEAEEQGEVLRYVGVVDAKAGTASVKLGRYAKDHPFASTQFADNIVAIHSKWYKPRPLVIQGPGAGAEVTAAGIFGNIIEVAQGMRR